MTHYFTTTLVKADLLNNYFCSISDLDDNNINSPSFATRTDERLTHITITCKDILDVLQVLKLGKTCVQTSTKTFYIFTKRLAVFPDNWKIALVLPLFKNSEKQLPANYQPIALLSTVGKVFERVVFKNMFIFSSQIICFTNFNQGLHQTIQLYIS